MHKHKVPQGYSPADLPICAKIGRERGPKRGLAHALQDDDCNCAERPLEDFNRYLRGLHLSVDGKLSPCGATLTALLRIYL